MDSQWRRSTSRSYSQTGRPVLMADEIRRLGTTQLILARGLHPILCDVERVYLSPRFRKSEGVTLVEVIDTIGRPARDNDELMRFAW
jgi:hypothetical protein